MLEDRGYSLVSTWLLNEYFASSFDTLVRQGRAVISEDFFFTQLSESLSLKPNSGYQSSFRFSLYGLSFNGFSTNTSRQKSPLYACCVAAVGYFAGFFSPSAPNTVSAKQHRVFAASEKSTVWRTILYSSQNLHNLFEDKSSQVAMFYSFCQIRL